MKWVTCTHNIKLTPLPISTGCSSPWLTVTILRTTTTTCRCIRGSQVKQPSCLFFHPQNITPHYKPCTTIQTNPFLSHHLPRIITIHHTSLLGIEQFNHPIASSQCCTAYLSRVTFTSQCFKLILPFHNQADCAITSSQKCLIQMFLHYFY